MLRGNLSDLPFLELLQTLASGSGGVLKLQAPGVEGQVGLAKRRVVAAEALGLTGLDALTLLAGLRQGQFVFETPPPKGELNLPLERVLTDLAEVADAWRRLRHLPADWSRTLRAAQDLRPFDLSPEKKRFLAEVEGKSVAEALAVPERVMAQAETLDRLLQQGALLTLPSQGLGPVVLVALPYYGPQRAVAYVDQALYQRWAERAGGPFRLRVRTPRGLEASYSVEPREQIPERIMLHDRELRRLRVGRGTKLKVMPEVEDGSSKP